MEVAEKRFTPGGEMTRPFGELMRTEVHRFQRLHAVHKLSGTC